MPARAALFAHSDGPNFQQAGLQGAKIALHLLERDIDVMHFLLLSGASHFELADYDSRHRSVACFRGLGHSRRRRQCSCAEVMG